MAEQKYIRGSEWTKWDLHVHTPCSLVQEYGGDQPAVWDKFIDDLEKLPSEFKAIGINDYIFLDGYKKVLEYRNKGRLQNIDLILPVIELRLDKFASLGADDAWKRVNFHIIFSNELTAEVIEANFLKAIQHKLKIEADTGEEDFNEVVTPQTLAALGKKIKENSSKTISDSDIKTGFNSLAFNFDVIYEKLGAGTFKDKYLTAVGKSEWDTMRWDGSPGVKRNVINKASFVFCAVDSVDNFHKHKLKLIEQKVNDRLLDCSDAHKFSDSENSERRIGNCFTWLKANTTFEGLKQIVKESTRVFIGDLPPIMKRVRENPTRYIKKLSYKKADTPLLDEIWFDGTEISINSGMVAIIGNKGNGKSALSDTLGLVGNTPNHQYFSFLERNKFRAPRPNRSESFSATVTWENDKEDTQQLSQNPHPSAIETVKYIPQGFLETLCNENHENFEEELRNVIFTHIPDEEKLNKTSLKELEQFKTDSIQNEIANTQSDLKKINQTIIDLEKKDTSHYREQVESSLEQKKKELDAHNLIKPQPTTPPSDQKVIDQNKETTDKISEKREQLTGLEKQIQDLTEKKKTLLLSKATLNNVISKIRLFEDSRTKLTTEIDPILSAHEINISDIITVEINTVPMEQKITSIDSQLAEIAGKLNSEGENSIEVQAGTIRNELTSLQALLDEPSKLYQKYIDDLAKWSLVEKSLIGDENTFATIKYYEAELKYLAEKLEGDLSTAIANREKYLKQLFEKKLSILEVFKTFYKPITDFIAAHGEVLESYEIRLDIENKFTNFEDKFLSQVSAGAKGSFIGIEEGRKKLSEILFHHECTTTDGVVNFLNAIIEHLKFDKREGLNNDRREVEKQLKNGYTVTELYDFLFNLDYLEPSYKLKLNGKNISELSPGERGALLLIFYLALDKNDIPLVIDQPEENLDNQSVFKLLAQFIKKAKEKRQVIIVTHNPNLAVVCDADQIIHVRIEKTNKNKVQINAGALENPDINKAVVDILEGTYEAFDTRDTKYKVIPRNI